MREELLSSPGEEREGGCAARALQHAWAVSTLRACSALGGRAAVGQRSTDEPRGRKEEVEERPQPRRTQLCAQTAPAVRDPRSSWHEFASSALALHLSPVSLSSPSISSLPLRSPEAYPPARTRPESELLLDVVPLLNRAPLPLPAYLAAPHDSYRFTTFLGPQGCSVTRQRHAAVMARRASSQAIHTFDVVDGVETHTCHVHHRPAQQGRLAARRVRLGSGDADLARTRHSKHIDTRASMCPPLLPDAPRARRPPLPLCIPSALLVPYARISAASSTTPPIPLVVSGRISRGWGQHHVIAIDARRPGALTVPLASPRLASHGHQSTIIAPLPGFSVINLVMESAISGA
ncbi:hypothetical protein K438DRAFT_2007872 [Mycena galopus ATCC 62051]|nr:hypothetical protein K438DRAFT_2007872 [Mycena galopus ATCC 62051]